VSSIGDLALAPSDPNILYVGTGEANNRQSASIGNGVWSATNAMAADASTVKFEYIGLRETQSIARMIVHPKDPNTCGSRRRALVRPESRARRVHDDRRRQDLEQDAVSSSETPAQTTSSSTRQSAQPVGDDVRASAHGVGLRAGGGPASGI
jgi:hypothetical protein